MVVCVSMEVVHLWVYGTVRRRGGAASRWHGGAVAVARRCWWRLGATTEWPLGGACLPLAGAAAVCRVNRSHAWCGTPLCAHQPTCPMRNQDSGSLTQFDVLREMAQNVEGVCTRRRASLADLAD